MPKGQTRRSSTATAGSRGASAMRLGVATVRQRTLKRAIPCSGIGLHSGLEVNMVLHPAEAGSGIVFRRTDISEADGRDPIVPALWDRVVDTTLCTRIANDDGVSIGTIEHLMAALAGAGIDNAVIDIDGPETPVMDGSSEPFGFLISCAGVVEQSAVRNAIRVLKPIQIGDAERGIRLEPTDGFSVSMTIDFPSSAIGRQEMHLDLEDGVFADELARARTFGFVSDLEKMRAAGLARGASLENAVAVDGDEIVNEGGLRYEDEFVRHKILDCVGDLYLAGAPLHARVVGSASGHRLNNDVLRALFEAEDSWVLEPMAQGGLGFALPARSAAASA